MKIDKESMFCYEIVLGKIEILWRRKYGVVGIVRGNFIEVKIELVKEIENWVMKCFG